MPSMSSARFIKYSMDAAMTMGTAMPPFMGCFSTPDMLVPKSGAFSASRTRTSSGSFRPLDEPTWENTSTGCWMYTTLRQNLCDRNGRKSLKIIRTHKEGCTIYSFFKFFLYFLLNRA